MQGDLDQLWYTWSKNGLDAMAMGYRVRAASGELRQTQSMRYRTIDRFLRYEPPQGININEFDAQKAPISYAFISNATEHLLIRKVFKGRDLAGRNSVFFTHLIAGLPDEFTARDAIRLWDCMDIWVESEDQKAPNDTQLLPIPYALLKERADRAQPARSLPFATIRVQLENLLLKLLYQNGLSQTIYLVGHANLAAALIYGLTHTLPMSMLGGNFAFTTYESMPNESDATIVATVTGAEMVDLAYLDVRTGDIPTVSVADAQKYKAYVATALNALTSGNVEAFLTFLKKMERHNCRSSEQLLEEFNLHFGQGPLTFKQLETIVLHADEYAEKLRDPFFQQQSATLLAEQREYWQKQGAKTFQQVVSSLRSPGSQPGEMVRQALDLYLNNVATALLPTLREGLQQFKAREAQGQDPWQVPQHCGYLLVTLVPPPYNEAFWLRLLQDFAQPPLLQFIKSDALWPFQGWLLEQAGKLPQPQHALPQVQPWLDIPSWAKLEEAFALKLPREWLYIAIYGRIQDIPKGAVPLIQKQESTFVAALQHLLQQGGQANINAVSAFFQTLVEYGYPNRVPLLLSLINTYYEVGFVQPLFACVGITTVYRLQKHEIQEVLAGCRPEAIATCNRAQALADYLREFILTLTPAKLNVAQTSQLLNQLHQLSAGPGLPPLLPDNVANLVNHWLALNALVHTIPLDRHLLVKSKTAIVHIINESGQIVPKFVQTFADEFVPMLIKLAQTEADLELIIDVLGTSMTSTRWDLLRWMALLASPSKTRLYELMPYLVCGLRESERNGLAADTLDAYLRTLLQKQPKDILKNIDAAVSYDIWPDNLRQQWENWRNRGRKGFPLPSLRGNTGRLPDVQQPRQNPIVLAGPDSPASTNARELIYNATPAPISGTPNTVIATQAPAPLSTIVELPGLRRAISYEEYARIHQTMRYLLPYWLERKLPMAKNHSKSLQFEMQTLQQIQQDLLSQPNQISQYLAYYIADDALIEATVRSNADQKSIVVQALNPDNRFYEEFTDFQRAMNTAYDEVTFKPALYILIRRFETIKYFDAPKTRPKEIFGKNDLAAFLTRERSEIQVKLLS